MSVLPSAVEAFGAGAQAIVVPYPGLYSHDGVVNVRYWVKMNVSPETSLRWIGTIGLWGSFTPVLIAAIAGSSHDWILPE